MRVEFNYIPKINKDKFFLNGFAEQKILFVVNVVERILEKNKSLNKIQAKYDILLNSMFGHRSMLIILYVLSESLSVTLLQEKAQKTR